MEEHYNWWNSGHSGYQFFWKTSADGYNLVKGDATMAEVLLAENWDVISIQESLFKNMQSSDTAAYLAQNEVYRDKLIPMLQKAFPNAEIYWHQQWSPEVGFDSITDETAQNAYVVREREAAQAISEKYGIKIVNTGDAWAAVRAGNVELPAGGLCARLGEDNFAGEDGGDGYHDGDIGGGQFLNACVWYETLTGGDCTKLTFRAEKLGYELDNDLVVALQNAAHSTVSE